MVPTYFRRELRDRVLQRPSRLRTFLPVVVMPGLVPGIHVFKLRKKESYKLRKKESYERKTWMAGTKPGHDGGGCRDLLRKNQPSAPRRWQDATR